MTRLAVIIIMVLDVVFLMAAAGPAIAASVTGRPLSVACGNVEPAECEAVWHHVAARDSSSGPIVAVQVVGGMATLRECMQVTIARWWFIPTSYSEPLC